MIGVLIFTEGLLFLLLSYMIITKSTAICIVISNIISAVIVFIYCILQAPDIAITEAVIGTATSTILYALTLLYIKRLPTNTMQNLCYSIDIRQKMFIFLICLLFCFLLIYIIQNLPKEEIGNIFGQERLSKLYIKNAIKDFGFWSIVTSAVAGYRAFDTMFENVVIFTGCYGFYTILKMDKKKINHNQCKKENHEKQST